MIEEEYEEKGERIGRCGTAEENSADRTEEEEEERKVD
jgi:hypothetical protein